MTICKPALLILLFLALGMCVPCYGEENLNPEVPNASEAAKAMDVVKYNNGTQKIGRLSLKGQTVLEVINLERRDSVKIALSDVAEIRVEIESATMEKVYRFKEEGSPEKIYSGEEYPLHKYKTFIILRNGVEIPTHLSAVLYLKGKDGKTERVFLLSKQAGTTTDNLEDLIFISHIKFFDRRLVAGGGKLSVQTPNGETPSAAVAIQWSRNQAFRGEKNKTGFTWSDLPPDRYDVFVVSGKNLRYFLSEVVGGSANNSGDDGLEDLDEKKVDGNETDKGGLTEERKAELMKYIATADEFFESKEAMDFGGNAKMVRSLVRQKRINETSYGTQRKKVTLWRYDIWFLHQIQKEWKIERRAFLWRAYLPQNDLTGLPSLIKDKRLAGIDLSKSRKSIVIDMNKEEQ